MEFLKKLKKIEKNYDTLIQNNEHIYIDRLNIWMSVQCGYGMYSHPQIEVPFNEYESMEIAFLSIDGELIDIYEIHFNNFYRKDELYECYGGDIYSYVPIDLINDVYLYLTGLDRKEKIKKICDKL